MPWLFFLSVLIGSNLFLIGSSVKQASKDISFDLNAMGNFNITDIRYSALTIHVEKTAEALSTLNSFFAVFKISTHDSADS